MKHLYTPSITHPSTHTQGHTSGGFTLVEVLLAMVLTVVLMTALMMISASSMQDRRRLAERQAEAEPGWLGPVARLIEADLLMGSGLSGPVPTETSAGGTCLYILTNNAQDSASTPGTPHMPVLVAYRLVGSGQGGVLLREQNPLTKSGGVSGGGAQARSVQVVATGIQTVQVGGATLSLATGARELPVADTRGPSAFTILVDQRPVAMLPIAAQTRLLIAATGVPDDESNLTDNRPQTFERTLLTQ